MILDRFRVDGRVAVVTGAGRGIGRGISIALAEAGANVVLAARRENTLQEVAGIVEQNGGRALVVPTDVLVPEQLDRLVDRALSEFGGVDFLVNNAGGTLPGPALQCTDEELNKSFNFNVTTAFHMSRALAPSMAERGHGAIVNITSFLSHGAENGFVAYGTAKAAHLVPCRPIHPRHHPGSESGSYRRWFPLLPYQKGPGPERWMPLMPTI